MPTAATVQWRKTAHRETGTPELHLMRLKEPGQLMPNLVALGDGPIRPLIKPRWKLMAASTFKKSHTIIFRRLTG